MRAGRANRREAEKRAAAAFAYHTSLLGEAPSRGQVIPPPLLHICRGVTAAGKPCMAFAGGSGYCVKHKGQGQKSVQ